MGGQPTNVRVGEGASVDLDTGLLSLVLVARCLGRPADPGQLRHLFGTPGTPFGDTEISRGARSLGLKVGRLSSSLKRLDATPMPAIALLKDGHYVVLAQVRDGQIVLQDPREPAPSVLARIKGDLWDSGKVLSEESAHIPYAGKPLISRTRCWWAVRVWQAQAKHSMAESP